MEKKLCFWCGSPIGRHYTEKVIGGVNKPFHTGILKDCANEHEKWHKSHEGTPNPNNLLQVINAARKIC